MVRKQLIEEIQDLEDAYAEALSDDADARTLSVIWDRIKMLTCKVNEIEHSQKDYACS